MSYVTFLVSVIAGLALLCWAFPAKTNQSNTEAALSTWAQGCKAESIRYGAMVNDETHERAFVVVCPPGSTL